MSQEVPAELSLNMLSSLDDLAAIVCRVSVELSAVDGADVLSCGAHPDLRNPFDLVDRWEQLNDDGGGNIADLPTDFALYEIEIQLVLAGEVTDPSAYLRPIIERSVSQAVNPDRDEKIGNPRSMCWASTLMW